MISRYLRQYSMSRPSSPKRRTTKATTASDDGPVKVLLLRVSDRDFGLEGGADSHGAARQGNPAVNHLIHACVSQLILGAGRGI